MPLFFHDVRDDRVDAITRVDFTGGWDLVPQNPRLARKHSLPSASYYEIILGRRYWYLFCNLYHPIDDKWLPLGVGNHPQDLEWTMVVWDTEMQGVVAGMSLFHHLWFWAYVPGIGVKPRDPWAGALPLIIDVPTGRPMFHVQTGGHGIRPFNPHRGWERRTILVPHLTTSDIPWLVPWNGPVGMQQKSVRTVWIKMTGEGGLYAHRNDPSVFRRVGKQDRMVMMSKGRIVPSPATPLWASGADLRKVIVTPGDVRIVNDLVRNPNDIVRCGLRGIAEDTPVSNPFLD